MEQAGPAPIRGAVGPSAWSRSPSRAKWAVVLAFLVVNGSWMALGGIVRTGGDTQRYQIAGAALSEGRFVPRQAGLYVRKATSYLAYDAVIAVAMVAGTGMIGVVAFQLCVAALAALAQYDLGRTLGGPWSAALAAGLLVLNPDIARWHTYILTESLFTSSVILTVWAVHRASLRPGPAAFVLTALAFAFTLFLRPNGWVVAFVVVIFLIARFAPRRVFVAGLAGALGLFALGAVYVPALHNAIQAETPEESLRKGEVIWGHSPSRIPMPEDLDPAGPGWTRATAFVVRHPLACARLACVRVFTEFSHVRPFYSKAHNALVVVFLFPTYVLAIIGLWRSRRDPLAHLLALVVAGQMVVIALTFADWDGRFLLYVLPQVIVLAGAGLVSCFRGASAGRFKRDDAPTG